MLIVLRCKFFENVGVFGVLFVEGEFYCLVVCWIVVDFSFNIFCFGVMSGV